MELKFFQKTIKTKFNLREIRKVIVFSILGMIISSSTIPMNLIFFY